MEGGATLGMDALPKLVNGVASVAVGTLGKALDGNACASCLQALQRLEAFAHSTGEGVWEPTPSTVTAMTDFMELVLQVAGSEPPSCVLMHAWIATMNALLQHSSPVVINASTHAKRLWESAQRQLETCGGPGGDAALATTLTLLRVILLHQPVFIECTPKTHLPSLTRTPGVLSRVAAVQLVPFLVLASPSHHQASTQQRSTLAWPWFEYLRKAVLCTVPPIRENGVRALRHLLQNGIGLDAANVSDLLEVFVSMLANDDIGGSLEGELSFVIGRLLATLQCQGGWVHFCAATAKGSTRITKLLFDPTKMNPGMQRILSGAIGELLLLFSSIKTSSVEKTIQCAFDWMLQVADTQDESLLMANMAAAALGHWARATCADTHRGAIVQRLTAFLDTNCSDTTVHASLLSLETVVPMVVEIEEYAPTLWSELLRQASRNSAIKLITSRVMSRMAEHSRWCQRALLRYIFTSCCSSNPATGAAAYLSMMPLMTMHVCALTDLPDVILRQPCVLGAVLSGVVRLSVDDSHDALADVFHWCVEYFSRLSRLLIVHQRQSLPTTVTKSVRATLRTFLGALVSGSPTAEEAWAVAPAHAQATAAACELLPLLEPGDTELKLVVALLETLDNLITPVAVPLVRDAVYKLLGSLPWETCRDAAGKRRVVVLALEDLSEAIRLGVPCEAEGPNVVSKDNGNNSPAGVTGIRLCDAELVPCEPAARLLGERGWLGTVPTQDLAPRLARSAVQLIATAATAKAEENGGEDCLLRCILENLRQWRHMAVDYSAVLAWNILCCLDAITAAISSNPGASTVLTGIADVNSKDGWFVFLSTNWLGHEVWAVRLLAARVLARLALATDSVDSFTSATVNETDMIPTRISGALIALGLMHGSALDNEGENAESVNKSSTSVIAMSFVTRIISQYGLCGGDEALMVVSSALMALIRLSYRQKSMVYSAIRITVAPRLLVYNEPNTQEKVSPIHPLITTLLLELVTRLSLHKGTRDCSVMTAFSVAVVSYAAAAAATSVAMTISPGRKSATLVSECGHSVAMSDAVAAAVLEVIQNSVQDVAQPLKNKSAPADVDSTGRDSYVVDPVILQNRSMQIVGNVVYVGDMVSRAAARLALACYGVTDKSSARPQQLFRLVEIVDAAGSAETRNLWTRVMGMVVNCVWRDPCEREACLQTMGVIMRAKPVHLHEAADDEQQEGEACAYGGVKDNYDGEVGGASLAGTKNNSGTHVVTSDAPSKVAVLTILSGTLEEGPCQMDLKDDILPVFLQLFFGSIALVEVSPCLVQPAADALRLLLRKYGDNTTDAGTPFLQPWKAMLVSGMVHVVERCGFCSDIGTAIAEEFFACNVADDSSARRIVSALTELTADLRKLDSMHADVSHGGRGRVALSIAKCCATACNDEGTVKSTAPRWPQALKRAYGFLALPETQAVVALMCSQLVAAMALAHKYEPPQEVVSTPLDTCTYVTPSAVIELLLQIRNAACQVDDAVRNATGYLIVILLAAKVEEVVVPRPTLGGVSLQQVRALVPLLPPAKCETLVDTVLTLLPTVLVKEISMNEGERMGELMEIAAAAAAVVINANAGSVHVPGERSSAVRDTRRGQAEQLMSRLVAERHRMLTVSLAPLIVAVFSDCSAECLVEVLSYVNIDTLLGNENTAALSTQICLRFPPEELRAIAHANHCAFFLALRHDTTTSALKLLDRPDISPTTLSYVAEALMLVKTPMLLANYIKPLVRHSTRVCGVFLSAYTAIKRPQRQHDLSPFAENILLGCIGADESEEQAQSEFQGRAGGTDDVAVRVAFFVKCLICLSHLYGGARVFLSRHPKVCAVLMEHVVKKHANELKNVIQSLQEGDTAVLREVMQLQGAVAQQQFSTSEPIAAPAPQRLKINLSSFT
ncbi:unnamed protein product [Trypanosoma congolense IL3000]|uniref:WGS project CAEQ00000000 data, annotated contig 2374 n=1 Tax=Trypanosoma congolense (strain IL3000) TaxID=1068625 RepID=F9WDK5_TRYCI|nr:unnamed protein product [Trypanosoma congolense IL3000]